MTGQCSFISSNGWALAPCYADATWIQRWSTITTRGLCDQHIDQARADAAATGVPCEFERIVEKTEPDAIDNVLDVLEDIGLPGVRTDGLPRMRRAQVG